MKESPLIIYIVHFIVCVTVMVMVSLEIRKYGTQDMLLCALKWFSLTAVIGSGLFLDDKIKKVKEKAEKKKVVIARILKNNNAITDIQWMQEVSVYE